MMHLFVGIDTGAAKAEARKRAEGELVVFGEGGQAFEDAPSLLAAQGLFSPKVALLLDCPLETPEGRALIEEYGTLLHESTGNVFLIETALAAEHKKLFPKGVELVDFGKPEQEERPAPFALADLFLAGDRKRAWIEYRKLLAAGISPEEIHGTLSWGVRSALLTSKTQNAEEAGLKPFVYAKSKRALEKLGLYAVEMLSRNLVAAYHRARRGEGDMERAVELLILEKI